jgi:hypothetical protein
VQGDRAINAAAKNSKIFSSRLLAIKKVCSEDCSPQSQKLKHSLQTYSIAVDRQDTSSGVSSQKSEFLPS